MRVCPNQCCSSDGFQEHLLSEDYQMSLVVNVSYFLLFLVLPWLLLQVHLFLSYGK